MKSLFLCLCGLILFSSSSEAAEFISGQFVAHLREGQLTVPRGCSKITPGPSSSWLTIEVEKSLLAKEAQYGAIDKRDVRIAKEMIEWLDLIGARQIKMLAPDFSGEQESRYGVDWHNRVQIRYDSPMSVTDVMANQLSSVVVTDLSLDCPVVLDYVRPNDPYFYDAEQPYDGQWYVPHILLEEAWHIGTGSGATIGIIDNGFCQVPVGEAAPELLGIWNATSVTGWVFTTGFCGEFSHGTAVASVMSAVTDNGIGFSGVSRGAHLCSRIAESSSDVAESINSIIAYNTLYDPDVRVINISLEFSADAGNAALNAIRAANLESILIVAGSGNGESTPIPYNWYPHSYEEPNLVAVGATDLYENVTNRVDFSNYGSWLDLVAPGRGISTVDVRSGNEIPIAEIDPVCHEGTSYSSPIVAAVAAIMFRVNPDLTPDMARNLLNSASQMVGNYQYVNHFNIEMGHGLLDAGAAVRAAIELNDFTAPTITLFDPADGSTFPHGNVAIRINAQDDRASDQEGRGIDQIRAYVDNQLVLSTSQTATLWGVWIPGPIYAGPHTVRAEVQDYAGNLTTQTHTFTMTTNNAPILLVDPGELTLYVEEIGSASGVVSITNGGDQTLNWYVDENNAEISESPTSGATTAETDHVSFTFSNNHNFDSGQTFTYSDVWIRSNGGDARIPITIHVIGNSLPDLRSGNVEPPSGESNELYRFHVEYRDHDNVPPTQYDIVFDGHNRHEMQTDAPQWDTYVEFYFQDYLSPGNHYYHFEFADNAGASVRWPTTGERSGPIVTPVEPEIHITRPASGETPADQSFMVEWTATSVSSVDLYWDNDTDPVSGLNVIATGVSNTGSFVWNTSSIPNGTYWVYGIANNQGMVDTDYSEFPLPINHSVTEPNWTWSSPEVMSVSQAQNEARDLATGPGSMIGFAYSASGGVYYRRSVDGGLTWSDSALTGGYALGDGDMIIDSSGNPFIFGMTPSINEASLVRSTDGGLSWLPRVMLFPNDALLSGNIVAELYGNRIHTVYMQAQNQNPNWQLWYRYTDNSGGTWSTPVRVSNYTDDVDMDSYAIECDASGVYISWIEEDASSHEQVYFRRSTNNGATWSASIQVSPFSLGWTKPILASNGSDLYLFCGNSSSQYVWHSLDHGATWLTGQLVPAPEVGFRGMGYCQDRLVILSRAGGAAYPILLRESTDHAISWSDTAVCVPVTPHTDFATAFTSTDIHLTFFDNGQTQYQRTVVPLLNNPPSLVILSPGAGSSLADSLVTIQWNTLDPDSLTQTISVDLYYDSDQDPSASIPIQTGLPRSGTLNWNVTNVLAGTYYIFGRVSDGAGGLASDYSSGVFLVNHRPSVAIAQPADPDTANGSVLVQYTAIDPDAGDTATVTLFYSLTADTSNRVLLDDSLPSAGSYLLSVCDLPQGTPLWIVARASDSITAPSWAISNGSLLADCAGPWFGNGAFSVPSAVPGETGDLSFTINCSDSLSSLIEGQPVFMYKRGNADAGFSSSQPMTALTPPQFTCTIPAVGDWSSVMGQQILLRVRAEDVAGNITQPGDFTINVDVVSVPDPVDDLVIQVASNHQDIELHWSPTARATSYNVYADSVADFEPSSGNLVATTTDTVLVDVGAVVAQSNRFYVVSASASQMLPQGMILIPEGPYQMGATYHSPFSLPIHTVDVPAFYIDINEVTNAQYKAFCDATSRAYPPDPDFIDMTNYFTNPSFANYPVVNVFWQDAKDFADWAGKRLPSEAEWERAAKGHMDNRVWPWGDTWVPANANINNNSSDGFIYTSPVGNYPNGNSPAGCYDMAGNVWEWCEDDWHDNYNGAPTNGIAWTDNPRGATRIIRGGSWSSGSNTFARCAYRSSSYSLTIRYNYIGFRCAKTP